MPGSHPVGLFVGDGSLRTIRFPWDGADEGSCAGPTLNDSGALLILADPGKQADRTELHALVMDASSWLRADGHIAVLLGNPGHLLLSSVRGRLRPSDSTADENREPLFSSTPSVETLTDILQDRGYTSVKRFAVGPSVERPTEIRPFSWLDRWTAPASLVVARRPQAVGTSRLERIIHAVRKGQPGNERGRPERLLRVLNSPRGKSIAFLESGGGRLVVRIARSHAMRADEARSFEVLREIQSNPAVSAMVPRPVASGTVDGTSFFAQSHLDGEPLSRRIRDANRAEYLREVDHFLRALNPDLTNGSAVGIEGIQGPEVGEPMVEFVLRHVRDAALRAKSRALIEDSLRGAVSRRGFVHGDFGTGNILVSGRRVTGIIDWEAARKNAPPVLDAFNYLDSTHRCCTRGLSIIDTLPMLADGDWPISAEMDFLREHFRRCGVDFRYRRGFALLYFLFHVGPQLRFTRTEDGPVRRLEQVLRRLLAKRESGPEN